jgi:hypothetical protein
MGKPTENTKSFLARHPNVALTGIAIADVLRFATRVGRVRNEARFCAVKAHLEAVVPTTELLERIARFYNNLATGEERATGSPYSGFRALSYLAQVADTDLVLRFKARLDKARADAERQREILRRVDQLCMAFATRLQRDIVGMDEPMLDALMSFELDVLGDGEGEAGTWDPSSKRAQA